MKTNTNQSSKEMPLPSKYGAAELIIMIRRNTIKSFLAAMLLILVTISGFFLYSKAEFNSELVKETFSYIPTAILNIAKEMQLPEENPVVIPKSMSNKGKVNSDCLSHTQSDGSANTECSGQQNANNTADNGSASFGNTGGKAGPNKPKPEMNSATLTLSSIVPQDVSAVLYNPDRVVAVDKEPYVDYEKFHRCLVYPSDAIKSEIAGLVLLKVLIDEYGNTLLIRFPYYKNAILAQAVQDAVRKYGKFEPAKQNGKAIKFWITIPIEFKLVE